MRSVSVRLADLCKITIPIGFVGENLHTRVKIDCMKLFEEYPDAYATMTVKPADGDAYPAVVTQEGDFIIWDITDSDLVHHGIGEFQLSFVVGEIVAKSYIGKIRVDRSIVPTGDIPDPVENWIGQATELLEEIEDAFPEGGTKGQVLAKASENDFDTEWVDLIDDNAGDGDTDKTWSADKLADEFNNLPDPQDIIDDTAGEGDTDKVWSADKITDSLEAKANKNFAVFTNDISLGRKEGTVLGYANSVALGSNVEASGPSSFASGSKTRSTGVATFAEGNETVASDFFAHAEGTKTEASNIASHAEGMNTRATQQASHAEGAYTEANGYYSHAQNFHTIANGMSQSVSGRYNVADDNNTYAEIVGNGTSSSRSNARTLDWSGNERLKGKLYVECNADGTGGKAVAIQEDIQSFLDKADTAYQKPSDGIPASDIEDGVIPDISGKANKADTVLDTTLSRGRKANTTVGTASFAFGKDAEASGSYSYAQGYETTASANYAYAEGFRTTASGPRSHAEGDRTSASGDYAHAEGGGSKAQGITSHAEGGGTVASGIESHAEGGHTTASGKDSHAEGAYTVANHLSQHVFGQYNIPDPSQEPANNKGTYVEIVGNGENANNTSNARALDWNGNERIAGDVYVHCESDSTGGTKLPNESRVNELIASAIGGISSLNIVIVQQLPQTGESDTIYFVPKTASTNDLYDEYMYINNSWELIGTKEIDLSSKADKADTVLDTTLSRGRRANSTVGTGSFAFGAGVVASGDYSHAESQGSATGMSSHAEGTSTTASGVSAHAEGVGTTASGNYSHAEGDITTAKGIGSHAEGRRTVAIGKSSHAEGQGTVIINGDNGKYGNHSGGQYNVPGSMASAPEWKAYTYYNENEPVKRTAGGVTTYYVCYDPHTSGSTFKVSDGWIECGTETEFIEIIGNGISTNNRSNARTLDWGGNERLSGDVYVGCNTDSTGGTKLAKITDIPAVASIEETQAIITEYVG